MMYTTDYSIKERLKDEAWQLMATTLQLYMHARVYATKTARELLDTTADMWNQLRSLEFQNRFAHDDISKVVNKPGNTQEQP